MVRADSDETFTTAAFGSEPGRWPLPAARTPRQLWLRAIAAGGQGRFASSHSDLAALLAACPGGWLAAAACVARASFLRQLGWHALARGWDGRAVALAGPNAADPETPELAEVRADALIGLAADALGMGRLAASAALLARGTGPDAAIAASVGRVAVRRAWVTAELAMAAGDGATAVRHAEKALESADEMDAARSGAWLRHRIKSEVVLAAALCCAGDVGRARLLADATMAATAREGLVPLQWATACLLADLGSSAHRADQIILIRDRCADEVRRRGGRWAFPLSVHE